MSVGLHLRGTFSRGLLGRFKKVSSHQELQRIGEWFQGRYPEVVSYASTVEGEDGPTLYVSLHPAAEDVGFNLVGPDGLTVQANTSTAGPGFHIFLCDTLHRMGTELSITWANESEEYLDETGYFHSGNQEAVFQHMRDWIEGVASLFFDGTLDGGSNRKIAMPMDTDYTWETTGALTAMGPRDMDWLRRSAEDGGAGIDFFAWWDPELNARYYLGRALARMWSDIRWRRPSNDTEKKHLQEVVECLDRAYKLDSTLEYPWAEWLELLHILDRRDEHGIATKPLQSASIGYRRRDVKVQLPGSWWVKVPGSFSDFLDDGEASYALAPPREVWYTGYGFIEPGDAVLESWKSDLSKAEWELFEEREGYFACARIEKRHGDEGSEYFALNSSNVSRVGRCICTILFPDLKERDWAISTWKSLEPPQEKS